MIKLTMFLTSVSTRRITLITTYVVTIVWLRVLYALLLQVQQAIVVLMDNTLRELRGAAPSLDSAELTVESCIFHSFDRSLCD